MTDAEQLPISVVLIRRPEQLGQANEESLVGIATELASLHGGAIEHLLDGSILVVIRELGEATDQAATAARLALAIRGRYPSASSVVVSGRGVVESGSWIGEVLDRGAQGLTNATPGLIRVDDVTARLLDGRFVLRSEGDGIVLDGLRSEPVDIRELVGKPAPFVGRARELGALEGALEETITEPCSNLILVTAGSGVGKSRLRHEFLRRISAKRNAATVLIARGDPLARDAAYYMLTRALMRAAGIQVGEGDDERRRKLTSHISSTPDSGRGDVLSILMELTGRDSSSGAFPTRVGRPEADDLQGAWIDWLRAECDRGPVVLVLEDLQWSDHATLEVIAHAHQELDERPFFVLALARPTVPKELGALWSSLEIQEIELEPISKRASHRLVRSVLGDGVSRDFAERLVVAADGNPLFLEELVRGAIVSESMEVPESLLGILQTRLQRLPPNRRQLLRAASVYGQTFWRNGLTVMLNKPGESSSIEEHLHALVVEEWIAKRAVSSISGDTEYVR